MTTVTQGALLLGSSQSLPGNSAVTLNGGLLGVGGATATIGSAITIGANPGSGLYAGKGGQLIANGVVSGAPLVKSGLGEVTLGGANTFPGRDGSRQRRSPLHDRRQSRHRARARSP